MKKLKIILCAILIAIFGVAMVGCGENYDNFSLTFSAKQIEMSVDDKDVYYNLRINNYTDFTPHFDFDFTDKIVKIDAIKDLGYGVYELKMNPLKGGTTNLTITLLEGNKTLTIPVRVVESISGLSLNSTKKPYVLRGQSITFDQSYFTFEPEETLQRDLIYTYNAEVLENGVFTATEEMPTVVQITATSASNENVYTVFELQIVEEIDTLGVSLKSSDNEKVIIPYEEDATSYVEIVANDETMYSLKLNLHYDVANNYRYELLSKENTLYIEKQTSNIVGIDEYIIQQDKTTHLSEDYLLLRIYHSDFDGYYKEITYRVELKNRPREIKINGQTQVEMVNLFNVDTQDNHKTALLSVNPSKSSYDKVYLEFYIGEITPERQRTYEQISKYLIIKYNDMQLQSVALSEKLIIDDLSVPLEYYGVAYVPSGEPIYIRVVCDSKYTEVGEVSNYIPVMINKAATNFSVSEDYENATIYVKKGEIVSFDGFKIVESGAFIGSLYAYPEYGSVGYVNVVQTQYNTASIDIEALKVGTARYTLILSSGIQTSITIVVKEELSLKDFKMYVANVQNKDIGEIVYKNNGLGSLESISVRGVDKKIAISSVIFPLDADLFEIEMSSPNTNLVDINNFIITTKALSEKSPATIKVKLSTKTIEDFKIVEKQTLSYDFELVCFNPIKSFKITAKNQGNNDTVSNVVSVYNAQTVGYTDRALSKIDIISEINPEDAYYKDIIWSFSCNSLEITDNDGNILYYELNNGNQLGYFYPDTQTFVCDGPNNDSIVGKSFQIFASIRECGITYTSSVQVIIEEYVMVDRVWLYNYVSEVYLDAAHLEQTLYPYIYPSNANNKNLSVWFEPDAGTSSSVVAINFDANKISIKYTGIGSGSGTLKIVPIAMFEDAYGTSQYAMSIPVTVADGTKQYPLRISSMEEFIAINTKIGLSRHYCINTILDASGYNLETMGEFSGSITGYDKNIGKNVGGFVNLNIKNPYNGSLGLFSTLTKDASITNLSLSGKISYTGSDVSNVGMVAGVNYGLIKNVNIILSSSNLEFENIEDINIGGVVGINYGAVACDIVNGVSQDYETSDGTLIDGGDLSNFSPTSTLFVYMPETEIFEISVVDASSSNKYYIGGIIGNNQATLDFHYQDGFNKYNMYGISANVYISCPDASAIGGAVGYNDKTISNIVTMGELNGKSNVGGLVGYMSGGNVKSCESRTFVRGENYIAGLVGLLSAGSVSDSYVKATDDGERKGINASLIVVSSKSASVTYNEICNIEQGSSATTINCDAYSYITRTKVEYDDEKVNDVNNNVLFYYGEIFVTDSTNTITGSEFVNREQSKQIFECIDNEVNVMMYYSAQNSSLQSYISDLNIQSLPKNTFKEGMAPEITIVSYSTNIIGVETNGSLKLMGTGIAKLRLYNTLNAKDYYDITIYVTNAVDSVELYLSSDFSGQKISTEDTIIVTNRTPIVVYPKVVTNAVEAGNVLVALNQNTELKLCIDYYDNEYVGETTENYIKVTQAGQTLIISGDCLSSNGNPKFSIIGYYEASNHYTVDENGAATNEKIKWYLNANGELTLEKPNLDLAYNVNYTRGIYKIDLDKTNVTVVPSDVIKFTLSFKSDNQDDKIKLQLHYEDLGIVINLDSQESIDEFNKYFTLSQSDVYTKGTDISTYYIDYTIKMNQDNIRQGIFNFKFMSSGTSNITKTLRVKYLQQPITNVIVKNYTFVQNNNIELGKIEGTTNVVYNTSYTMQESDQVTAGETNILRLFITPSYADFAYVDISNDASNYTTSGVAQFSLLKYKDQSKNGAIVSSEGYYNSTGIRILSSTISDGDLMILYKIPTNVVEGSNIKINISFYNHDGSLAYETISKNLSVVLNKNVTVTLDNKTPEITADGSLFYRVARGYEYRIKTNIIGYSEEEITVITTSPYANIIKRDGMYFLKIAEEVSYGAAVSEGLRFQIESYGSKTINGKVEKSVSKFVECTIVEYAVDVLDVNAMFNENLLGINVGNTVDIRKLALNNLDIEYAPCAEDSVTKLKNDLISNASWWYRLTNDSQITYTELTKDTVVEYNKNPATDKQSNVVKISEGYLVTPLVIMDECTYNFGISCELSYVKGYINVSPQQPIEEGSSEYDQTKICALNIETRQNTSEDHPWPIYNYDDLLKMSEDGYYILMNDIEIPNNFTPITTRIKSLDGNSYSFIFNNIYSYSSINNFGLFEEVSSDTILKNITIYIKESSTFNIDNTTNDRALSFGLLASVNNGIIYNAEIKSGDSATLKVVFDASNTTSDRSTVAGLCAVNNGYITNSRVGLKIETTGVNLAGFVGTNTKHIANCYVSKSNIRNSTKNVNNTTGGFVLANTGSIYGSYIKGNVKDEVLLKMYSDSSAFIVQSSSIVGAFAYTNSGIIEDCYSDIPVVSSSKNSGFVAINEGEIYRTYTTSLLGNNDTENYPFFIENIGKFEDCLFLRDADNLINVSISNTNDAYNHGTLAALTLEQFATGEVKDKQGNVYYPFENYVVNEKTNNGDSGASTGINTGVWFMPYDKYYAKPTSYTFSYYMTYNDFRYKGELVKFVARRPELVSANLLAYSEQVINEAATEVNEETGETIYSYMISSPYATLGSVYNPRIIKSVEEFESSVLSSPADYYRLVCDLDYVQENAIMSGLYRTTFAGYLDGNSLSISSYSINDGERLVSAGYFAQIGNGNTFATVKNLTLRPKYINLPNAFNVGSLAGMVNRAYIYNVEVDGYTNSSDEGLIILGRDIVGGVIGRTVSAFEITNVYSSVSANSTYTYIGYNLENADVQKEIIYSESRGNASTVSYSGSIVGYVGGSGTITNPIITNQVASIGMISGLYFGGIGEKATVTKINAQISNTDKNFVRASVYGGGIVGDIKGTLSNVVVCDMGEEQTNKLFREEPKVPLAVGGVAGIIQKGTLINISSNLSVNSEKIYTVGGIAGKAIGAILNNCAITQKSKDTISVSGVQNVGGLIGYVDIGVYKSGKFSASVELISCSVGTPEIPLRVKLNKSATQNSRDGSTYLSSVYVGGAVGHMYMSTGTANRNDYKQSLGIGFNNLKLFANIEAKVSIFGEYVELNKEVSFEDSIVVYASGYVGGVEKVSSIIDVSENKLLEKNCIVATSYNTLQNGSVEPVISTLDTVNNTNTKISFNVEINRLKQIIFKEGTTIHSARKVLGGIISPEYSFVNNDVVEKFEVKYVSGTFEKTEEISMDPSLGWYRLIIPENKG